jgi:hypothetical protein
MAGAAILLGGNITKTRPYPDVERFDLGSVAVVAVEPFDILGPTARLVDVEDFWIDGLPFFLSVEPFDLGSKIAYVVTEVFDIMGPEDALLPSTDLGDGLPEAATAQPIYGWWETAEDVDESLGTMATD